MSKFATKIPVDTESVRRMLPAGAYVHAVTLEGGSVVVTWEHGQLHTGLGFPVEFTQNDLGAGSLPNGVTDLRPTPADLERLEVSTPEPAPEAIEIPVTGEPPKTRRKKAA